MGFIRIVIGCVIAVVYVIIVQQNNIMYGSCRCSHKFSPTVFALPHPIEGSPKKPGQVQIFKRETTAHHMFYFVGNGMSIKQEYWRLGMIYNVCNCTLHVLANLACYAPITWVPGYAPRLMTIDDTQYLAHALEHVDQSTQITIMGTSLDTGRAIRAVEAQQTRIIKRVTHMILENPFTTVSGVLSHILGVDISIGNQFIFDHWNNDRTFSMLVNKYDGFTFNANVLILTSEQDDIVPLGMSTTLMNICTSSPFNITCTQCQLPGCNHGDTVSHPRFFIYCPSIFSDLIHNKKNMQGLLPKDHHCPEFPLRDIYHYVIDCAKQAGERLGWSEEFVGHIVPETMKALVLLARVKKRSLFSVSPAIDQVWHEMILETKLYIRFYTYFLKKNVHHSARSARDPLPEKHERQQRLMTLYTFLLGDIAHPECWELEQEAAPTVHHHPTYEQGKKREREDIYMTLTLKSTTRRILIFCSPTHSISTLKAKYCETTNTPIDATSLVFAGNRLNDDDATIADINIPDGANVYVVHRLSGC